MIADLNGNATVLDYALAYHRAGFSTGPVRADGTKAAAEKWGDNAKTLPSEQQVTSKFAYGDRGIALIHGEVSGGTEVIDLDHGDLLDPFVEALDHAAPGLYQKLCVIKTPRPGYHLYYRCDTVEGNQKLARRPATAEEIAAAEAKGEKAGPVTLIETRGRGGYTLAPGSPAACHETGRTYEHFEGPTLDNLERITPKERDAMLWAARSLDRMPIEEPKLPAPTFNGRAYDGESPGDAYAGTVTFAAILEPHGWDCVGASGDRLLWRRPGKTEGISATTGNVSKQGNELLCVFSTNAHPFDGPDGSRQCSTHTKFDAYARLNHGGDYSAAAKELARQGLGDKPRVEYADPGMRDYDPSAPPREQKRELVKFNRITSHELATGDFRLEYLIEGALVAGQPAIFGGAQKTLKTSLAVDAGVSLSVGGYFLGRMRVTRPCRVLMMSGESGLATLQETASRIAYAAGHRLEDLDNLIWSDSIPKFASESHLDALEEFLRSDEIEVVFIDPCYLAMPSADAGNLMAQGELLRNIGDRCQRLGVTFCVLHHTKRGINKERFAVPELEDLAWSGFAEYFRQWVLIGRREEYRPGTGDHRLWVNIGGSAGHQHLWGVAIDEGVPTDPGGRRWDVVVTSGTEAIEAVQSSRSEAKAKREAERDAAKADADREAILRAMVKHGKADTQSKLASIARISNARALAALTDLIDSGDVREVTVEKNGRDFEGFEMASEADPDNPDNDPDKSVSGCDAHTAGQGPL
jgi:hypothetical protein